jgi:hypothetical protein
MPVLKKWGGFLENLKAISSRSREMHKEEC